jgi:hypothetical protein
MSVYVELHTKNLLLLATVLAKQQTTKYIHRIVPYMITVCKIAAVMMAARHPLVSTHPLMTESKFYTHVSDSVVEEPVLSAVTLDDDPGMLHLQDTPLHCFSE